MPIFVAVLVGAALAILLVRSGIVTVSLLMSLAYGALGGLLGIMLLRFVAGPLGPAGAVIAASDGGVSWATGIPK